MNFPEYRMRRYRKNEKIRNSMQDISLNPHNFIQPLFVHTGSVDEPIASMPGIYRYALKNIAKELDKIEDAKIPSVLIFPIPLESEKTPDGKICTSPEGSTAKIIETIAKSNPNLTLFTDLCLCPFTTHGHCGVIKDNKVLNDATLSVLADSAVNLANAGADFIAPSGMMDGMVSAIRKGLDKNNLSSTGILSYSIKFASNFYGPFREAAHSSPEFGDRKEYQMDYKSAKQILEELRLDIEEGTDAVMVKPALPYLDVIKTVRENCNLPLAVYQVSGEYSMLIETEKAGIGTLEKMLDEIFFAFRRAGADWIISYFASNYCKEHF